MLDSSGTQRNVAKQESFLFFDKMACAAANAEMEKALGNTLGNITLSKNLLEKGENLKAIVANNYYCGAQFLCGDYVFSAEKFGPNPKQKTTPPQEIKRTTDIIVGVEPSAATAYWVKKEMNNADGTRKGGAFAESNFSLYGVPIGAELNFTVGDTTPYCTEILVNYYTFAGERVEVNKKAFAVHEPSPQYAVDVYIITVSAGKIYIRLVKRNSLGPDYPDGYCTIGGFVNAADFVEQALKSEITEEGGKIIGDNKLIELFLGLRNKHGRDPRYMPFTFTDTSGSIVKFGLERGSTAHAVVHFVESLNGELPQFYKGTDIAETVLGRWVEFVHFIEMSNDPLQPEYIPWMDHQEGSKAAIALLISKGLIPKVVIEMLIAKGIIPE